MYIPPFFLSLSLFPRTRTAREKEPFISRVVNVRKIPSENRPRRRIGPVFGTLVRKKKKNQRIDVVDPFGSESSDRNWLGIDV